MISSAIEVCYIMARKLDFMRLMILMMKALLKEGTVKISAVKC